MANGETMVKASYVLQFLWRCLTSPYDVLGPYYPSESGLPSKFTASCLMETIHAFHTYNFQTILLVADGASSNLALFKILCGRTGPFGHNVNQEDKHWVPTSFTNPFSGEDVHILICPSHQVQLCNAIIVNQMLC